MADSKGSPLRDALHPAAAPGAEATDPTATPEDVLCLQSALASRRQESESLPEQQPTRRADPVKPSQSSFRRQDTAVELEVAKRRTHNEHRHLEAEIQAARSRLDAVQKELERQRVANENLGITNAELTTVLEAAQWRLAQLEVRGNDDQQAITRLQGERDADAQRLSDLEQMLTSRTLEARAASTAHQEAVAALASSRERQCALDECVAALQCERDQLERALSEAERERSATLRRVEEGQRLIDHLRSELVTSQATATHTGRELEEVHRQQEREQAAAKEQRTILEQRQRDVLEQRAAENEQLVGRIRQLEETIHERDLWGEELRGELQALRQQHTQALQSAAEAGRRREEEWRATQRMLQQEFRAARQSLAEAQTSETLARKDRQDLEAQLSAEQTRVAALADEMESLRREGAERLTAEAEREHALERQRDELRHQVQRLWEQAAAGVQTQQRLTTHVAELEHERDTLCARIDEMIAATTQLERECERLQRDHIAAEETRKLKTENARLEAKIADLDRQRSEATQRHSAAVAGYMVELNQRTEALQASELELQAAREEIANLTAARESAMPDLRADREGHWPSDWQPLEQRANAMGDAVPRTEPPQSREPVAPRPRPPEHPPPASPKPIARTVHVEPAGDLVTVIHLEGNDGLREVVRGVVAALPGSRYLTALPAPPASAPGTQLVVVNLLNRAPDAVAALRSLAKPDADHPSVLAYCADAGYGFSFGAADFFSDPIDPEACVERLLESYGTIHRLLAMTENFGLVGALREVLSRLRGSVAAALDTRQVLELLPMVEPDVVLVDLALTRGEGLRLVTRLRSDPKTRDLPLAVVLPPESSAPELFQHLTRAARALKMAPNDLAEALRQRLGATDCIPMPGGSARVAGRD